MEAMDTGNRFIYSTGRWIGGSDSECSDSKGGDVASEAGEDHDEMAF